MAKKTDITLKAKALGFRSGFESLVADELEMLGWKFEYEHPVYCCFNYYKTVTNGRLLDQNLLIQPPPKGNKVVQLCQYTVDFAILNSTPPWYIETKGYFKAADMAKHKRILAQYPTADIRLLFQYDHKIPGKGVKRYSDWCKENGVQYGFISKDPQTKQVRHIPQEWL